MAGAVQLSMSCTCQLTVAPSAAGETLVLHVAGDVDRSTHHLVRAALVDACGRGSVSLVVDLEGLTFCDASAASLFLEFGPDLAASHGMGYALSAVPPRLELVRSVLWPSRSVSTV